jgi:hypothetical protein
LLLRFLKRFVSAFFVVNSFFIHVEVRVIDCPVTCVKTVQFPFLVVPPHLFFTRQDLRLLGLLLSYLLYIFSWGLLLLYAIRRVFVWFLFVLWQIDAQILLCLFLRHSIIVFH